MQVSYNHLTCVAESWGESKKNRKRGRGRGEKFPSPLSPPRPSLFFCSRPNFRAAKTSKFATETLATQANNHHSISGVHRRGPTPQNFRPCPVSRFSHYENFNVTLTITDFYDAYWFPVSISRKCSAKRAGTLMRTKDCERSRNW